MLVFNSCHLLMAATICGKKVSMLFRFMCGLAIIGWIIKKIWEARFSKRTGLAPEDLWRNPTPADIRRRTVNVEDRISQIEPPKPPSSPPQGRVVLPMPGYQESLRVKEEKISKEVERLKSDHPFKYFLVRGGMPGFAGVRRDLALRINPGLRRDRF
jgi:hypothetical protein